MLRTQEPTFLHLQILGLYRWVVSAKCLIAAARCMPVAMLNFVSWLAHWTVSPNEYSGSTNGVSVTGARSSAAGGYRLRAARRKGRVRLSPVGGRIDARSRQASGKRATTKGRGTSRWRSATTPPARTRQRDTKREGDAARALGEVVELYPLPWVVRRLGVRRQRAWSTTLKTWISV